MKHAELMTFVGKNVRILFFDGEWVWGKLGYVDEFSAKHNFRRPNYFYIGNTSFKVSHVKKLVESEESE
jgi:hypothetical protein